MQITVYHNPQCGTSRTVLALLREAGIEPVVIEYLRTPPSRATLCDLLARMGAQPRDILRRKGTPYDALGLADPSLGDDALLDAIEAHPILIERPIVVAPHGVKLCRPAEKLFELLPALRSSETAPS
jgi:arsenate reductase